MISRGSEWHRWDPHTHAPGTLHNDKFGGEDPWESYLSILEARTPVIEALGITDYYVTDTYEKLCEYKKAGRIPGVKLLFPNIELRLEAGAKSSNVNIHLLVSPEDPNHLTELNRILTRLEFRAHEDPFNCTREELIRLGRRDDPDMLDDTAALRHGALQFKVNFNQLRDIFKNSKWAERNILVAVAGGSGDGTSGLSRDAGAIQRAEIEKFADIIFSGNPKQSEFWNGNGSASREVLRDRYNGCKPCLHGSDAHDLNAVGQPAEDRYSWIKGGLEFDALRQACIIPDGRAYVGKRPPNSAMPSQIISSVQINDADWATTPDVPLNSGLVAIIGARGSGKTALADVIAVGCDSITPEGWNVDKNMSPSFLVRAQALIGNAKVILRWGSGEEDSRFLDGRDVNGASLFPRARYLSQQFVEELCSSKGVSDGLVDEIERVVFESYPYDDRGGAIDFSELRDHKTTRFRLAHEREAKAISDISDRIANEFEKGRLITELDFQLKNKKKLIEGYTSDLATLVIKGTEAQTARHTQLGEAAQLLRERIQRLERQRRSFFELLDEVRSMRATGAPEMLRQVQVRHSISGLNDQQWEEFLMIYQGDVEKSLVAYIEMADKEIRELKGSPVPSGDLNDELIHKDADLSKLQLAPIAAEMQRLEMLIGADKRVQAQYKALTERTTKERIELKALEERLTDAQGATARRKDLQVERDDSYRRIFEAIIHEQKALADLYAPLMTRLAHSTGTLNKLSFSVRRIADAEAWGAYAEKELVDLRKSGKFQGRGKLITLARNELKAAWETGSAAEAQAAIKNFTTNHLNDLLEHAPVLKDQQTEYRDWLKRFAHWLYSTEHISVKYEVSYEGVDIRNLSPGTRGIVLLLLYLALDDSDDRPLIIDQPEENLDPKSVYDELVDLFVSAKSKRQVIIVTHNANLVINTDADQIIIAEAGPHPAGGLPKISYKAGGLESADIRKTVCDILEGGEAAFQERARRLRVHLDR